MALNYCKIVGRRPLTVHEIVHAGERNERPVHELVFFDDEDPADVSVAYKRASDMVYRTDTLYRGGKLQISVWRAVASLPWPEIGALEKTRRAA